MNPSSFSSISFEAETAIKFKKFAKTLEKTHTELLNELLDYAVTNSKKNYDL